MPKELKILLGAGIALVVVLAGLLTFFFMTAGDSTGTPVDPDPVVAPVAQDDYDHPKVEIPEKEVVTQSEWEPGTHQPVEIVTDLEEVDPVTWDLLRTELEQYVLTLDFDAAYTKMEAFAQANELSDEAKQWHFALSAMSELAIGTHDDEVTPGGAANIVNGLSVPQLTVAALFALDEEAKSVAILDANSALPILESEEPRLFIGQAEELTETDEAFGDDQLLLKDIRTLYPDTTPYRVNVEVDGFVHTAVLLKDENGRFQFYHLIKDVSAPYETVGFWQNIYQHLN